MAYTPTTWASGDTITATKLNKMESGIANAGVMVVEYDHTTQDGTNYYHYFDKTYAEVETALKNNIPVYYRAETYGTTDDPAPTESSLFPIFGVIYDSTSYAVVGMNCYNFSVGDIFRWVSDKNSYLCIYATGK